MTTGLKCLLSDGTIVHCSLPSGQQLNWRTVIVIDDAGRIHRVRSENVFISWPLYD
jgi:hypothetical protein